MTLAAVVVTFGPGDDTVDLVRTLVAAGCRTLVVDNGSTGADGVLERCAEVGGEQRRLDRNRGVAAALNAALGELGADTEWLLTFDQDSSIDSDYVMRLSRSAAGADRDIAIVAPVVLDARTGRVLQGDPTARTPKEVPRVITSGAMCRVAALSAVGGLRDDLFIDYVDFDVCLRLRSAGWRIQVDPRVTLSHSIGRGAECRIGGVMIRTSNHAADRQYYKYRNFLLLLRAGTLRGDRRWAARSAASLAWTPVRVALLEDDRRAKLRAVAHGVRDGLRGRGGPRP